MKILPKPESIDLKEAVDLTPHCECAILKIGKDMYAFSTHDARQPFLVIESKIFGLLMRRLKDRIAHYYALRTKCL